VISRFVYSQGFYHNLLQLLQDKQSSRTFVPNLESKLFKNRSIHGIWNQDINGRLAFYFYTLRRLPNGNIPKSARSYTSSVGDNLYFDPWYLNFGEGEFIISQCSTLALCIDLRLGQKIPAAIQKGEGELKGEEIFEI